MSKTQALHAAIEWRRMADQDTYYALRDGPRIQKGQTAIATLSRYLPPDHVSLAHRIAARHSELHGSQGRGKGEVCERVQGGDGGASREDRMRRMSKIIQWMAGLSGAACGIGTDGQACYRGICLGDTQAEMMRRAGYPRGSVVTFRRLVQETMIALAARDERHPLDLESNSEAYSR